MKYKLILPPLQTPKGLFSEVGEIVELEEAAELVVSGILEAIAEEEKPVKAKLKPES